MIHIYIYRKFPKMGGVPPNHPKLDSFCIETCGFGDPPFIYIYIYTHYIYEIYYVYMYIYIIPIVNVVYEPTNITGRRWGTTLCLSAVQGSACARAASTLRLRRLRCSQEPERRPESPPGTRPGPT